jgi:hypothetical protein
MNSSCVDDAMGEGRRRGRETAVDGGPALRRRTGSTDG